MYCCSSFKNEVILSCFGIFSSQSLSLNLNGVECSHCEHLEVHLEGACDGVPFLLSCGVDFILLCCIGFCYFLLDQVRFNLIVRFQLIHFHCLSMLRYFVYLNSLVFCFIDLFYQY